MSLKDPDIINAVDKNNLKILKNDFATDNSNIFCRVSYFKNSGEFEKFKALVEQKFAQVSSIKVI